MRVGIDARPALFNRAGFGRVARELLLALRRRPGLTVLAYGAAWRRARPDAQLHDVCAPRFPARLQQALAPLGFGVETLLGPLDVFQHTDLVYAPVRRAAQVLALHDVAFLRGQPWHDPGFVRRVEPRLRRAAARARAIVVPCERVALDVLARGLCDEPRLHVVPLGCDHVQGEPQPGDAHALSRLRARAGLPAVASATPEHGPLVLALGTREPRKNQLALLTAFLGLPRGTQAALLFVGPAGWGCPELEARLADRALAGRVGVLGEVGEADLGVLLRCTDVVAYPSFAEGFGLPVAEALRCGRAVLTAIDTPMADYGGDAVLAVDPRDQGALAEALAQLVERPALRAQLGSRGVQRVAAFTWDAAAERLHRLYQDIAGSLGASSAT